MKMFGMSPKEQCQMWLVVAGVTWVAELIHLVPSGYAYDASVMALITAPTVKAELRQRDYQLAG